MTCGFGALAVVVGQVVYKAGWGFRLESGVTGTSSCGAVSTLPAAPVTSSVGAVVLAEPLRLVISVLTADSGDPGRKIVVCHRFGVPPIHEWAAPRWQEWLLRRIIDVETHEACEFFQVAGQRPFFPEHGPGGRLYAVIRADDPVEDQAAAGR